MAKSNATAASMAHPPEKCVETEQVHAHKYPGVKPPKGMKVMDASHDAAEMKVGMGSSMGTSANGSHKGLPASYEYVGHKSGAAGKDEPLPPAPKTAHAPKHDAAALAAGRTNSMGTSADGSHKGIPTSMAHAGQR